MSSAQKSRFKHTYILSHQPEIQIPVLDKFLVYPTEGLMLDLDRCMLVEHRAGGKLRPAKVFKMAAILDGRQKYDLNRKR